MEASKDLGLYSRFAAASLATTEEQFSTPMTISSLRRKHWRRISSYWSRAKSSCHGLYGRVAYLRPTILGMYLARWKCCSREPWMCSRRVNNIALSATDLFNDLAGKPRGHGEDIILSFAGMAASKHMNLAYRLPAKNHAGEEPFAIHRSWLGSSGTQKARGRPLQKSVLRSGGLTRVLH